MNIYLSQPCSFIRQGQRNYQEDARFPDTDRPSLTQHYFIVCDGVGGSDHGQLASKVVCEALAKKMGAFNLAKEFTNDDFSKVLDYAYDQLDKLAKGVKGDMATTLTFLCFHGNGVIMAHIGDSRIYQVRPEEGIIYRTDDHSLVNNMVHRGVISPEEGIDHPRANMIIRCMEPVDDDGYRGQATVLNTDNVRPGDIFLLCSDGVYKTMTDDELVDILTDGKLTLEQKNVRLAERCKDSDDNNTAFLLQVEAVAHPKNNEEKTAKTPQTDENETKRFARKQNGTIEIESVRKKGDKGLLGKLKKIFS